MADDGKLTPEKQLLNLIEGADKLREPQRPSGAPPRSGQAKSRPAPSLGLAKLRGMVLGRLAFFKRSAKKKGAVGKFSISLGTVNRVMVLAVVALFFYVAYAAANAVMTLKAQPNFAVRQIKEPEKTAASVSPLKEVSFYQRAVTSRDIFKEGAKPVERKAKAAEPEPVEESNKAKDLSLVGISWSANPDVIIEDKANQRTYFVKRGQTVGDGVRVEAIFKDHVVLSHEGREFELR